MVIIVTKSRDAMILDRAVIVSYHDEVSIQRFMFDSNGHLPAGLHDWSLQEIKDHLVIPFTTSATRPIIFAGYEKLRNDFSGLKCDVEQWLDGSFATGKVDPGDVDLLNIVSADDVNKLSWPQQLQLKALVSGKATKATHSCDSYFLCSVPDTDPHYDFYRRQKKYWMGEFGFDRKDQPKGIVRTNLARIP